MTEINQELSELWDEVLKKTSIKIAWEPNFKDLLAECEEKAVKEALEHLEPWMSILNEGIQWLSNLHIALDLARTSDPEKQGDLSTVCSCWYCLCPFCCNPQASSF